MNETKLVRKSKRVYHFVLVTKSWGKQIPLNWQHIIIAEALNYSVVKEGLIIKGYWLKEKRLYLIIESIPSKLNHVLNVFAKQILKEIHEYKKLNNEFLVSDMNSIIFNELFYKFPLYNQYIIKLITGKKVVFPYYNPHLVRLKDEINNYNYCSAIDYSGAIGPVIVQTH